jgi:predicted membrane protein
MKVTKNTMYAMIVEILLIVGLMQAGVSTLASTLIGLAVYFALLLLTDVYLVKDEDA